MDNRTLEEYDKVASLIHQTLPYENSVIVTDTEKFTSCYLCEGTQISKGNLLGKPFPEDSLINEVLNSGISATKVISDKNYGAPFKAIVTPIKGNKGNVLGTITICLSLELQNKLLDATYNISSSADQLSATTEEIAVSASNLSKNVQDVLNDSNEMSLLLNKTKAILEFVDNVASNSEILGLNASIEAARTGEAGKGFDVIAKEIRKMAAESEKSVRETQEIILAINKKVDNLLEKINELFEIAQKQAAANQEISASVQELASNAQVVKEVAENL